MEHDTELINQFILEKLRITPDAKIKLAYPITVGEREILIDLAIESRDTFTLVQVRPRIDEDTIYRIYAISHLINKQIVGKILECGICYNYMKDHKKTHFHISYLNRK
jgi:hypothetical protein